MGDTVGDVRSHPSNSRVRGAAMTKKAKKTLREKRKQKGKEKEKVKRNLKKDAYIPRVMGKNRNPKQKIKKIRKVNNLSSLNNNHQIKSLHGQKKLIN